MTLYAGRYRARHSHIKTFDLMAYRYEGAVADGAVYRLSFYISWSQHDIYLTTVMPHSKMVAIIHIYMSCLVAQIK